MHCTCSHYLLFYVAVVHVVYSFVSFVLSLQRVSEGLVQGTATARSATCLQPVSCILLTCAMLRPAIVPLLGALGAAGESAQSWRQPHRPAP